MSRFDGTTACALLVLIILGTLLVMGRDSALTTTFCSIAGVIFTKGAGAEVWQVVKKARLKGKLEVSAEGESEGAQQKAPPG